MNLTPWTGHSAGSWKPPTLENVLGSIASRTVRAPRQTLAVGRGDDTPHVESGLSADTDASPIRKGVRIRVRPPGILEGEGFAACFDLETMSNAGSWCAQPQPLLFFETKSIMTIKKQRSTVSHRASPSGSWKTPTSSSTRRRTAGGGWRCRRPG